MYCKVRQGNVRAFRITSGLPPSEADHGANIKGNRTQVETCQKSKFRGHRLHTDSMNCQNISKKRKTQEHTMSLESAKRVNRCQKAVACQNVSKIKKRLKKGSTRVNTCQK